MKTGRDKGHTWAVFEKKDRPTPFAGAMNGNLFRGFLPVSEFFRFSSATPHVAIVTCKRHRSWHASQVKKSCLLLAML